MDWTALIGSGLTLVAALVAVVKAFQNESKITELHVSLNSRLSELLKASVAAAHAEGREAGATEQALKSSDMMAGLTTKPHDPL